MLFFFHSRYPLDSEWEAAGGGEKSITVGYRRSEWVGRSNSDGGSRGCATRQLPVVKKITDGKTPDEGA
jgi:hypothetical protein